MLAGAERILWSSDYPHISADWPYSYKTIQSSLSGATPEERELILHGNALMTGSFRDRKLWDLASAEPPLSLPLQAADLADFGRGNSFAVTYFGPKFTNHNPKAEDGIEGFRALLAGVKKQFSGLRVDVKRAFADGDFVILHVHIKLQPEELGLAVVEVFRLEHGKIVEHWDVRQPMLDKSLNSNGMF